MAVNVVLIFVDRGPPALPILSCHATDYPDGSALSPALLTHSKRIEDRGAEARNIG